MESKEVPLPEQHSLEDLSLLEALSAKRLFKREVINTITKCQGWMVRAQGFPKDLENPAAALVAMLCDFLLNGTKVERHGLHDISS